MATHSSVLAWRIQGMREPGELPSMGSHRVGHDGSDLAAAAADFGNLCFCKRLFITDLFQCKKKVIRFFSSWGFLKDRNALCLDDSTSKT